MKEQWVRKDHEEKGRELEGGQKKEVGNLSIVSPFAFTYIVGKDWLLFLQF